MPSLHVSGSFTSGNSSAHVYRVRQPINKVTMLPPTGDINPQALKLEAGFIMMYYWVQVQLLAGIFGTVTFIFKRSAKGLVCMHVSTTNGHRTAVGG